MKKVALGIDIGGTNTKYGFVDKEGKVYCESSISTTTPGEKFEDYLNNLYNEVQKSLESAPEELEIIGVGVGAPNGNYFNGCIEFAANLPWKGIIRAAQLMGDKWGVPAYLTNDANAAAIGEMLFGTAKGMKDFIVITLGTG
ncbi:MAG: ROK family protein, partial [Flavobacteriales bacterium]|nr:ROK family protein [Flavobacteriales bacterium]